MLSTGQLRGHGAKVGFFSLAYEGGVFPLFRGIGWDIAKRRSVHIGSDCGMLIE
jgi:hypothetical protein